MYSNLSILMERFEGKNSKFIKCESYLREIIKLIKKDHTNGLDMVRKRSVYREAKPCRELEKTLKDIFGLGSINIYWECIAINACTITDSSFTIMKRSYKKDFSTANMHIVLNEQLIYYTNLNERELMAVILHEIGHNFYWTPLLILSELISVVFLPSFILLLLRKGALKLKSVVIDYIKKQFPLLINIVELYTNYYIQLDSILGELNIVKYVADVVKFIASGGNPANFVLQSIGGYGDERGADTFCAKYGYGAEQITALDKLKKVEGTMGGNMRKKMGTTGSIMVDLSTITIDILNVMTGNPHPNSNQRAQTMIKKLERDLKNSDYPPKMKSDLQKEIERLKKAQQEAMTNEGNVEIRKNYYNAIDKLTNGHSDIREILDPLYRQNEF